MEDLFPLLMFNIKVVNIIIEEKKYNMFPYFLPFSLILKSIFTAKMTRSKRLKYIAIAMSIMWVYFYELADSPSSLKFNYVFDKVFCVKSSLCKIIVKNCEVHLGALGIHFLEHFFDKIRWLCKNDDSCTKFELSVQISIIIQILKKYYGLELNERPQKSRLSDSGAKIEPEKNFDESNQFSVIHGMQIACKVRSLDHIIGYKYIRNMFTQDIELDIFDEFKFSDLSFIKLKHEKLSTLSYKSPIRTGIMFFSSVLTTHYLAPILTLDLTTHP